MRSTTIEIGIESIMISHNSPRVMTKFGAILRLVMDDRSMDTASSAPTVCKLTVSDIVSTSLKEEKTL